VQLQGTATDVEDGQLSGEWFEGEAFLGSGNNILVPLSPGAHTVTFTAVDSQSAPGQDQVSFASRTCEVEIDRNNNNQLDIGDIVALFSSYFSESLDCNQNVPQSYCIIELDLNANGSLDLGDFVLLLTAYSQESLSCGAQT
jgi:hypothetical protein